MIVVRAPLSLLAALLLLGIAGTAFIGFPETEDGSADAATIADGVRDFEDLQERFRDLAREKGGAYAFEVLRTARLPQNTDLHLLGHGIGDILYGQKGVDGIADCTQDFRNACSHSVVIGALNEFGGEAALPLIQSACKKAPGGTGAYTMCYHGLGHGVFAYLGYDLADTVEFCKKTGTELHRDREYIECVGGAVMELMGGGGHDREAWLAARERYLDDSDPLAPCMDVVVPKETKAQCLTYLTPRIWEAAGIDVGHPDPSLFERAFAYCDSIPPSQPEERNSCFGGFGKEFIVIAGARDIRDVASFPNEAYLQAIEWCELAEPEDGRRACIGDALGSIFWGGENDPEASFRFCSLVRDTYMQDACYSRIASAVRQYTQGDTRRALCSRLPDAYKTACEKI